MGIWRRFARSRERALFETMVRGPCRYKIDYLRRVISDERGRTAGTDTTRERGSFEIREGAGCESGGEEGAACGTETEPIIRTCTHGILICRDRERFEFERHTAAPEKELELTQKVDCEQGGFIAHAIEAAGA